MPALSTSYSRRKVAQKQLSEKKKQKDIPKRLPEAYPFKVAALSRGEVLGLRANQHQKQTKNTKNKTRGGAPE